MLKFVSRFPDVDSERATSILEALTTFGTNLLNGEDNTHPTRLIAAVLGTHNIEARLICDGQMSRDWRRSSRR
jgi:hypothetical protein